MIARLGLAVAWAMTFASPFLFGASLYFAAGGR